VCILSIIVSIIVIHVTYEEARRMRCRCRRRECMSVLVYECMSVLVF
jgi:hypothetical protein